MGVKVRSDNLLNAQIQWRWAKAPQQEGVCAAHNLENVLSYLRAEGLDTETEAAYKAIDITKALFDARLRKHCLIAAELFVGMARKAGPDETWALQCVEHARDFLRRGKFNLESEETYAAIKSTKSEFDRLIVACREAFARLEEKKKKRVSAPSVS